MKVFRVEAIEIYEEHLSNFYADFEASKSLEEDDIHRFRVDMKHLRAFIRLLQALKGAEYSAKKLRKLFKSLFAPAGIIRTAQVNCLVLNKYKASTVKDFRAFLEREERAAGKVLKETLKTFKLKKFNKEIAIFKELLLEEGTEKILKAANRLSKQQFKEIVALQKNGLSVPDLHDIRKLLKIAKTMTALQLRIREKKKWQKRYKHIKNTEQLIGNWHDKEILLEDMQRYIKTEKKIPQAKKFRELMMLIKAENHVLFQKIKKALMQTLAPVL